MEFRSLRLFNCLFRKSFRVPVYRNISNAAVQEESSSELLKNFNADIKAGLSVLFIYLTCINYFIFFFMKLIIRLLKTKNVTCTIINISIVDLKIHRSFLKNVKSFC